MCSGRKGLISNTPLPGTVCLILAKQTRWDLLWISLWALHWLIQAYCSKTPRHRPIACWRASWNTWSIFNVERQYLRREEHIFSTIVCVAVSLDEKIKGWAYKGRDWEAIWIIVSCRLSRRRVWASYEHHILKKKAFVQSYSQQGVWLS